MSLVIVLVATAQAQSVAIVDGSLEIVHTCDPETQTALVTGIDPAVTELARRIQDTGEVQRIAVVPAGLTTPTLDDLRGHDVLLVLGDPARPFADPDALGNVLRDRLLEGGSVVLAGGALDAGQPHGVRGALVSLGLTATRADAGAALISGPGALVVHDPDDWSAYGVWEVVPGPNPSRMGGLSVAPTAWRPVSWSDPAGGLEPFLVHLPPPSPFMGRSTSVNGDLLALEERRPLLGAVLRWSLGRDTRPPQHCGAPAGLSQDQNCNGLDVDEEPPLDPHDTACVEHDDRFGTTWLSGDWYYDPGDLGCAFDVAAFDGDGDGFGSGSVEVPLPDGQGWSTYLLECDSCPNHTDPGLWDADCDGAGDLCDPCIYGACAGDCLVADPFAYDFDADTQLDVCDLCPCTPGDQQGDVDADLIGDDCDTCPEVPNPDQADGDGDGIGDACDLCPALPGPPDADTDGDGLGDLCDPCPLDPAPTEDSDGDGVGDTCDVCPTTPDPEQDDLDRDGVGDACDVCPANGGDDGLDTDGDGAGDRCDVCPDVPDPVQTDADGDGVGDLCDGCPALSDPEQDDLDGDGIGTACDPCPFLADAGVDTDGDGVGDACDVCPFTGDADQADADGDGLGDACDLLALRGGGRGCASAPGGPIALWVAGALFGLRSRDRSAGRGSRAPRRR